MIEAALLCLIGFQRLTFAQPLFFSAEIIEAVLKVQDLQDMLWNPLLYNASSVCLTQSDSLITLSSWLKTTLHDSANLPVNLRTAKYVLQRFRIVPFLGYVKSWKTTMPLGFRTRQHSSTTR